MRHLLTPMSHRPDVLLTRLTFTIEMITYAFASGSVALLSGIGTKTQSKCSQPPTFGLVTFHDAQHERDLSRRVWRLQ
jgi:hypothetical protein